MKHDLTPVAIAVTWGHEMIQSNGGLLTFLRAFHEHLADEESWWLHKCKNKPKHEVDQVYIILNNRVAYRVYFGGYQTGPTVCYKATGEQWTIEWPRIILAGPVGRAPRKIPMRGFQGFKYIYEPLF